MLLDVVDEVPARAVLHDKEHVTLGVLEWRSVRLPAAMNNATDNNINEFCNVTMR